MWLTAGSGEPNTEMCSSPKIDELISLLNQRFISDSEPRQEAPKRRVPTEACRAIIRLSTPNNLMPGQDDWQSDHVIAYKSNAAKGYPALEHPIPLNHIANWMPLEASINAKRSNQPWAEFISHASIAGNQSDVIRGRLLIEPALLDSNTISSVNTFLGIMVLRWMRIVDTLLLQLNLDSYASRGVSKRRIFLLNSVHNPILEALTGLNWAVTTEGWDSFLK